MRANFPFLVFPSCLLYSCIGDADEDEDEEEGEGEEDGGFIFVWLLHMNSLFFFPALAAVRSQESCNSEMSATATRNI